MTETWKDIPGYAGAYQASSLGRIRSVSRMVYYTSVRRGKVVSSGFRVPKKILAPYEDRDGYLTVTLSKSGKNYNEKIHRLVLGAFSGSRKDSVVDHINGRRSDNRIKNLRWTTDLGNKANRHAVLGASGFRGVRQDRKNGMYQAYGKVGEKFIHLGYFSQITRAVKVRQIWEKRRKEERFG